MRARWRAAFAAGFGAPGAGFEGGEDGGRGRSDARAAFAEGFGAPRGRGVRVDSKEERVAGRLALTREELNELERKLQLLSPYSVEAHYREQWQKCEIRPGVLPSPRMMQQLVALWRTLWKWRRR